MSTNCMNDSIKTINDAKCQVRTFCEQRNWDQFHNPKDLAIGMVTESSELLELLRFKTPEECKAMLSNPDYSQEICDELADVFYFVLRFAQMNEIDLYDILVKKIAKNNEKYPVNLSKDCNNKYSEF